MPHDEEQGEPGSESNPIELDPGDNLDLTKDEPTITEPDGDTYTVRDDDSDGGGGGSDPSPEPDNNDSRGGGSSSSDGPVRLPNGDIAQTANEIAAAKRNQTVQEFKKTDEYNDNQDVITTRGDPSEGDPIRTAGKGETVEEARIDAAKNPRVDFAGNTPVGKKERQLDTNQPLVNPSQNRPEQVQKRLKEIAGSDKFKGNKVGRKAGTLAQQIEKKQQKNQSQKNQAQQFASNNPLQQATQKDIFTNQFTQTNQNNNLISQSVSDVGSSIGRTLQGQPVLEEENFGNEVTDLGSSIIQTSENFAEDTIENNPEAEVIGRPVGQTIAGTEIALQGDVKKGVSEALVPGSQTELAEKRVRQSAEGIVAGPGTLAGFTVGAVGASQETLSNEIEKVFGEEPSSPTFGEAVTTGLVLQGEAVSKNPGKFVTEEASEEAGEAISTLGVGALAPTITPDVTVSPESRTGKAVQKAKDVDQNVRGLISGNLGTRPRQDQLITRDVQSLEDQAIEQRLRNLEPTQNQKTSAEIAQEVEELTNNDLKDTTLIEENVERLDDGSVVRQVQGVQQGQAVQGRRIETPVTRKEFLKDRINREDLGRLAALGVQAGGLAAGAPTTTATTGASITTTPETTTTPDPDTSKINPDEVFSNTQTQDAGTISPETTVKSTVAVEQVNDQDQVTDPGIDQKPKQKTDPLQINDLIPETTPETTQKTTPETKTPTKTVNIPKIDTTITNTPSNTPSNTPDKTPSLTPKGNQQAKQENFFNDILVDQESEAAPSVDAILTGSTTNQKVEDDTLFSGLETREVEKDFQFNLF